MSLPAIEVSGLSKHYVIQHESRHDNLRDTLHHTARKLWRRYRWGTGFETEEFWALRDVSFSVQPGEVVGIIGRNGAGKSTLLKILSRITEPTAGTIRLRGRVASLLEVGTGFHPDLTGRENIFLNGAILGMSRAEIARKFDEIVAFAEIERFLDTPVKRYSSGMYVRLAFAVAAHLEPEILIVDEVLAVGDAQFQKKCLGKMQEVAEKNARTVLFVSHNLSAVRHLCRKGLLFESGRLTLASDTGSCIDAYLREASRPLHEREKVRRTGSGQIRLTGFRTEDESGATAATIPSGKPCTLVFDYESTDRLAGRAVDVGFGIHASTGERLFVFYASQVKQSFAGVHSRGQFRCRIPGLPLASGRYTVFPRVEINGEEADFPVDGLGWIDVEECDFYGSGQVMGFRGHAPYLLKGDWEQREH